MKILFLAGSIGTGGAARQFLELVQRVSNKGITPVVGTLEKNHEQYAEFFNEKGITHYTYVRKHSLDFGIIKSIRKLIEKEQIDLIQTWQPLAGLYGVIISKLSGRKVVCSSIRDAKTNRSAVLTISNKIQSVLSDMFVSNTKIGFDVQFRKWRRNFKVITNGIDLNRFKNVQYQDVRKIREQYDCDNFVNIVMAANLRKNKDPFTLIKAVHLLLKEFKIQLFIIGEGEIKSSAMGLSQQLGVSGNVHFLGYKQNIETYIAAFDISILLSETDAFQEGISNFLLESMALKKVVVATRAGGNLELIEHGVTGYLVNAYDAVDLKDILKNIIRKNQQTIISNAYQHVVQTFDMEAYVDNYIETYRQLLPELV